jgi:hopanoid-associated phosphorylase
MAAEARIVGAPGVTVVVSGGRAPSLLAQLEATLSLGPSRVLSFGLCGALDPALKPGDLIIATAVIDDAIRMPVDAQWRRRLAAALSGAKAALLAGVDGFVIGAVQKAALRRARGADVVDTESHIAAHFAKRHGLPFAALRAVSDGATRTLPKAVNVALRPDGHIDVMAVLRSVAAEPSQLPGLIRIALEAQAGLRTLARAAASLGPFGG